MLTCKGKPTVAGNLCWLDWYKPWMKKWSETNKLWGKKVTDEQNEYETFSFIFLTQEMIWSLNNSSISKWRKHRLPNFSNLAKGNRMLISKFLLQSMMNRGIVLHSNISRMLWRNVHKFFHCFYLAKENQLHMLVEMMTEKIHLKSEGWHHVSMMMKIEKSFGFLVIWNDFLLFLLKIIPLCYWVLMANAKALQDDAFVEFLSEIFLNWDVP